MWQFEMHCKVDDASYLLFEFQQFFFLFYENMENIFRLLCDILFYDCCIKNKIYLTKIKLVRSHSWLINGNDSVCISYIRSSICEGWMHFWKESQFRLPYTFLNSFYIFTHFTCYNLNFNRKPFPCMHPFFLLK